MKNIQFKAVTEEDRTFFIYVHHTAYRETVERMFGWDEKVQDRFANTAFDEGGLHIITKEGCQLGIVGWEVLPTHLLLKQLFLLPTYQGKGIGAYILHLSKERAQALGKPIRLQTLRTNLGAKRLYERNGFQVEEATEIHWKMVWRE
ncbi:MAG: GNAT family N-acetyltransferase [Bacteroidota bacterium]